MPPPRITALTNRITKVLIRELGWVEIEPGSFRYLYLTYMIDSPEGDAAHSGYEYPAFECKTLVGGETFYIQSDNIIGVQVAEEPDE